MQDHCTTGRGLKALQAALLVELIDLAMAELGYVSLSDEDYAVLVEECRKQVVQATSPSLFSICGSQDSEVVR